MKFDSTARYCEDVLEVYELLQEKIKSYDNL